MKHQAHADAAAGGTPVSVEAALVSVDPRKSCEWLMPGMLGKTIGSSESV